MVMADTVQDIKKATRRKMKVQCTFIHRFDVSPVKRRLKSTIEIFVSVVA